MCSPGYFLIFEVVGQVIRTQRTRRVRCRSRHIGEKKLEKLLCFGKLKSKMIGGGRWFWNEIQRSSSNVRETIYVPYPVAFDDTPSVLLSVVLIFIRYDWHTIILIKLSLTKIEPCDAPFRYSTETIGRIRHLHYTSGHNYCNSIIIEGLRIISVYRRATRDTALRLASMPWLSRTIASTIHYWSLSIDVQPWLRFDNRPILSMVKLCVTVRHVVGVVFFLYRMLWIRTRIYEVFTLENWQKLYFKV